MALLKIRKFPDPVLKKPAKPVENIDGGLMGFLDSLVQTMYAAPGVGLAATQVDVHERVLVMDLSEEKNELRVFVNPVIVWACSEIVACEEGCLSVPGVYEQVRRPAQVRVRAQDMHGKDFELECADTLAVCVQHEIDHLDGMVFVQHLSLLKQARVRAKLRKRRERR